MEIQMEIPAAAGATSAAVPILILAHMMRSGLGRVRVELLLP